MKNKKDIRGYSIEFLFFMLLMGFQYQCIADEGMGHPVQADMAWSEPVDGIDQIFYSYYADGTWEPKSQISNLDLLSLYPSVGSGTDGTTWIVWTGVSGLDSQLYYSTFNGTGWSHPESLPTDFTSNTAPCIVIDGENTPWVVWSGLQGGDDDIFITKWNGHGWDTPEMVNSDNQVPDILPTILMDPNGDLRVRWSSFDEKAYQTYAKTWDGSQWGPQMPLESGVDEAASGNVMNDAHSIYSSSGFTSAGKSGSIFLRNNDLVQAISLRQITR